MKFQVNLLFFAVNHVQISGYTVDQNMKTFEFNCLLCFKPTNLDVD